MFSFGRGDGKFDLNGLFPIDLSYPLRFWCSKNTQPFNTLAISSAFIIAWLTLSILNFLTSLLTELENMSALLFFKILNTF